MLQTTASSLSSPQHTSSCKDTQLGIKSSQAWISGSIESVEMTYLKVDLGTIHTLTGIQTLKFTGTFQILFGLDGNSNFTYRNLNGEEVAFSNFAFEVYGTYIVLNTKSNLFSSRLFIKPFSPEVYNANLL